MEDAFIITGGKPLRGEVRISGAKNIALKVLIAALLFDAPVTLNNIPHIVDIDELIILIRLLGVTVEFHNNIAVIDAGKIAKNKVSLLEASKIRAAFLLFAPLLYRFGEAVIPNPGGCRLGARSIDRIIDGLKALGIAVSYDSETGYYNANMKQKPSGSFRFAKSSHTGTEMMIMMAVFCEGTVLIENAAQEPEIDDLIKMFNEGGAKIKRQGNDILVEGVEKLHQEKPFTIASDRVEAATFAALGIATHGDVTIATIPDHYIQTFADCLQKAGAGVEKKSDGLWRFYYQPMKAIEIETAPYPGFLTDWQPLLSVILTQASGKSRIHERIFENRFSYVEELRKLGANIEFVHEEVKNPQEYYFFNFDPQKEYRQIIDITGPQKLHGGVLTVADLRAGATLAIAALTADGESYVRGVDHIERGYEDFVKKVRLLGGQIEKI